MASLFQDFCFAGERVDGHLPYLLAEWTAFTSKRGSLPHTDAILVASVFSCINGKICLVRKHQ